MGRLALLRLRAVETLRASLNLSTSSDIHSQRLAVRCAGLYFSWRESQLFNDAGVQPRRAHTKCNESLHG